MKIIFALLAALAAVSFPIYFVVFLLRLMILVVVAPIAFLFTYVCWKLHVFSEKAKARHTNLLTH